MVHTSDDVKDRFGDINQARSVSACFNVLRRINNPWHLEVERTARMVGQAIERKADVAFLQTISQETSSNLKPKNIVCDKKL